MSKQRWIASIGSLWSSLRKEALIILLLLLYASILYIPKIGSEKSLTWDEAQYASLARSLARGEGYKINFRQEYFRPPFFPILAAIFYKLSGESFRSLFLPALLLGMLSLPLLYLFAMRYIGRKRAFIAALLLAPQPYYWQFCLRVMTDVPFLFLTLLAMWLYLRVLEDYSSKHSALLGLVLALLYMTRNTSILVYVVLLSHLALSIILRKVELSRKLAKCLGIAIGSFLFFNAPYLYYVAQGYDGNPFGNYIAAARIFKSLEWGIAPLSAFPKWYFYRAHFPQVRAPLIWGVLFSLGLVYLILNRSILRDRGRFLFITLVLLMVVIPFAWFSLQPHKEPRYPLFTLPAICVICSLGASFLEGFVRGLSGSRTAALGSIALVIILGIWGGYKCNEPFFEVGYGWVALRDACLYLKSVTKKGEIIMSASVPQVHFFTERKVINFPKSEEEFLRTLREGKIRYIVLTPERSTPRYIVLNLNRYIDSKLLEIERSFGDPETGDWAMVLRVSE